MSAVGGPGTPAPPPAPGGSPAATEPRWERLKRIFGDALELSPADRGAFVAAQCGDDDVLRREVEELLASDAEAGSFAETPAAGLLAGFGVARPPTPHRRFVTGFRLGVYEVVECIGAGGMGEVYRARDTRLDREVAIKTVAADLGEATARSRLLREARHASSLDHPNICTIHEVGEADGLPYIVMQLVNGRALSECARQGPLPEEQSLDLGLQVARALEHAHARGIVHRDLKSSNVMLTEDGRAIVLDFGLARRLPDGQRTVTETTAAFSSGTVAGTLGYMAPELLLGKAADERSDIWSFGVLLHEMFAGELPFTGRTPFETSSAIIGEPPRALPRSVPLAIRLIVERCLQKAPAARYAHVSDVAAALESARRHRPWPLLTELARRKARVSVAVAGFGALALALVLAGGRVFGPAPAPRTTLAVLPLENASGDPSEDYYVDGMTEALTDQLGALQDVRVVARGSARRYRGSRQPVTEIARELQATAVVQGAVHHGPDRIALDARLVDARTGRVVWSERYERGPRDVLALQAAVVNRVGVAVETTVAPAARERLRLVRAVDPDVYEEYLKGRFEWNRRTPQSLRVAVAHFERAIAMDPTYAAAHAALADCYNQLGTVMVGSGSPLEYRPMARAAALKALQIDPGSADAHATLGYVEHYDWQWADAERQLQRAIQLNPSHALARVWYANLLMSMRRLDEALAQVFAARDLDPFSLVVNTNVGWILDVAGRFDEAVERLSDVVRDDPTYPQARMRLAASLLNAGKPDASMEEARAVVELTDRSPWSLSALAVIHARRGEREEARALLRELLEVRRTRYVSPPALANVYLALGDHEPALMWLEQAVDERTNAAAYLGVERPYDVLRPHPRYQALLARVRLN